MNILFPTESKATLQLPGLVGALQIATTVPKKNANGKTIIICHPHPLFGGTMDNKVITTLMRTFDQLGFKTVRFNFRGVGQTQGEHDHGIGEAEDVVAIMQWLADELPEDEFYLAGFSFGAYVAYRVAGLKDIPVQLNQLVLIAPPVFYPEFVELPQPTMPIVVLQGEEDEIVAPELVYQWVEELPQPVKLQRFSETSHFFHGKLVELKQSLLQDFA